MSSKYRVLPGAKVAIPADLIGEESPEVYVAGEVFAVDVDVPREALDEGEQWCFVEPVGDDVPTRAELEARALENEGNNDGEHDIQTPPTREGGSGGAGNAGPDASQVESATLSATLPAGVDRVSPTVAPALAPTRAPRRSHIPSAAPNKVEFVTDPTLLGLSVSPFQKTLMCAMDGLPLDDAQADIYRIATGRSELPRGVYSEVTVISGARGGKDSRIAVPSLLHEAFFGGHEKHLSKGEVGVLPLVAPNLESTRIAFNYAKRYVEKSPALSAAVAEIRKREIVLANGLEIRCFPCTMKGLRGWSNPVACMDEVAFFRQAEGNADSDREIQTAIRRGMLTFEYARLFKISTPYMKGGVLFSDYERSFGVDDPRRLVWVATSAQMHPGQAANLERERELADSPSDYRREFEAVFIDDLAQWLPDEVIDAAVVRGRFELPPRSGVTYYAAVDPSGGKGRDSFALTIGHVDESNDDHLVQDVIRGWNGKGIDLESVVRELCELLKRYRIKSVIGDRFGAGWVEQAFQRAGIEYLDPKSRDGKHIDRSTAYVESKPLFMQKEIELLDHEVQTRELKLLEAKPRAGGKLNVDHPRNLHDDHANTICLIGAYLILQGVEEEEPPCWITMDGLGTYEL